MFCPKCGNELPESQQFCPNCGYSMGQPVEEKANVGLAILSWFIPLAGLIIFLTKKDKEPKTAKASGICALISAILSLVISFGTVALTMSMTGKIFDIIGDNIAIEESDDDIVLDEDDWEIVEDDDKKKDEENVKLEKEEDKKTEKENEVIENVEISNDWKKYAFSIDGKVIELPCTYEELSKVTGAKFKSSDEKSYIEGGYYTLVNMYNEEEKMVLSVEIYNNTDEDQTYINCPITRISQSDYDIKNGGKKVVFPGNLTIGQEMTTAKLEEIFGKPSDTYEYKDDGYESYDWTYSEDEDWTTFNNFKVEIVNGKIQNISFDHRGFEE